MKHVYIVKTDFITSVDRPDQYAGSAIDDIYSSEAKAKNYLKQRAANPVYKVCEWEGKHAVILQWKDLKGNNNLLRCYYTKMPVL